VDIGTAVVTIGAAALALLPRVPALSADGRRQERLKRDLEILNAMPDGEAKNRHRLQVETALAALVDERKRDRRIEQFWILGTTWTFAGWIVIALALSLTGSIRWREQVEAAAAPLGLVIVAIGLLFMLAAVVLLLGHVLSLLWSRIQRRRAGPRSDTYEI